MTLLPVLLPLGGQALGSVTQEMTDGLLTDEFEDGPTLVRSLRTRAGLTQDALAEGAGVHVRTVRGLESGRVAAPRRTSIDLLAHALDLDVSDHLRLRMAWGLGENHLLAASRSTRSSQCGVDRHRRKAADERIQTVESLLARGVATLRKVTLNEQVVFGSDRRIGTRVTQEVLVAVAPGVTEHVVYYEPMDDDVDIDRLRLTDLQNCTVVREVVAADRTAKVFVLGFGRPLQRGESRVVHYTADFRSARIGGPATQVPTAEEIFGFLQPPASCVLEIHFAAAALPRSCARIFQSRPTVPYRIVGPLALTEAHTVHLALLDPKPGGHGIAWRWPDTDDR